MKMKVFKKKSRFISLFLAILIVVFQTVSCYAYTGFTNTPLRGQERRYWCWAACAQMLLETQGIYFTQTQIAGGLTSASAYETLDRLQACAPNIQWDYHNYALGMDSVVNTINSGWAILAILFKTGVDDAHDMVITGYKRETGQYDQVWLQDPWSPNSYPNGGIEDWCDYVALMDGNYDHYSYNSSFVHWLGYKWTASIC